MPLYEYTCQDCSAESEILVRNMAERPLCPACGGSRLTKLLSVPVAHGGGLTERDGPIPEGPCGSACGCFPQT